MAKNIEIKVILDEETHSCSINSPLNQTETLHCLAHALAAAICHEAGYRERKVSDVFESAGTDIQGMIKNGGEIRVTRHDE